MEQNPSIVAKIFPNYILFDIFFNHAKSHPINIPFLFAFPSDFVA
jgi:hypothetical protein